MDFDSSSTSSFTWKNSFVQDSVSLLKHLIQPDGAADSVIEMCQSSDQFIQFRRRWPGWIFPPSVCQPLGLKLPETLQEPPLVSAGQTKKKQLWTKTSSAVCVLNGKEWGPVLPWQTTHGPERATSSVLSHSNLGFFYSRKSNRELLAVTATTAADIPESKSALTLTHMTVVSLVTHRAMFLRNRLCWDTSLSANPMVSNSKMVNSCSRG